ncbi:MAG: UDP-N-acetylmuramoyl-L-alanine--D-glutamate ligase [Hyphomicrobiales bacterium]|nr:UDP-N-acetylmuramoyl-L-alanine--D-glutamate ligase [Hyphomicrobiales bacterium]MCP4998102.1 UDP-N-acetylmuramoyl-L-alanine--D-glutamate ligase [Hyphomicrobiales bacterium]
MIAATVFSGKKVALFGLGGSGIATAHSLIAGEADVVAWDDNPDRVDEARKAGINVADLRTVDWSAIAALVLAPGVPLTHPKPHWSVDLARPAGVEIIGDVEIFVRERRIQAPACPFIAITGTNGKSTTTALIAHILQEAGRDTQLGGNIGTAVLTLAPPKNGRFYVVECSSYQADLSPSINPTAGILLNLSPDHLDRHGTMQHYAEVKEQLVAGSDRAIVGIDDHWCARIADRLERAGTQVVRISKREVLASGYYAAGTRIMHAAGGTSRTVADLAGITTLRGAHNAQNAAAAIAACLAVGLSQEEAISGLRSFGGLKHRMQPVARRGRVLFVNDSKATNADAAAPALSSFKRIYWIAGGLPKEGGIEPLSSWYSHIAKAYLIGEAAPGFAATLGEDVAYEITGTLERAVERAADDAAQDGDEEPVILLSPACASFDQYKNFEIRGDAFVKQVAHLPDITMLVETGDS